MNLTQIISKEPDEIFIIVICMTEMRKLRHRRSLTQKCHKSSSKEQSHALHPSSEAPGSVFSTQR